MSSARIPVQKTHKLYIGGAFVRSESGRDVEVVDRRGRPLARLCQGSRKDLRNAVVAGRNAADGWAKMDPYLRGQILYRMAEMLEGKAEEMAIALAATVPGGMRRARREVGASCDRLLSWAGWTDKLTSVLGNANPVAGPYYNFSIPTPTGLVGVVAPSEPPLLGLLTLAAPALASGNVVVALASEEHPLSAALMGEVLATSDLPVGVCNLWTGLHREALGVLASHRGVDGIHAAACSPEETQLLEAGAAENLKRVRVLDVQDWYDSREHNSPWRAEPFLDTKTIWHPSAS